MSAEHKHQHDDDNKPEFDYQQLIIDLPMSKSFPRACCETKNHFEEMKFIPMVINFIWEHLHDTDVFTTIIIEENIKWVSQHLRKCGNVEFSPTIVNKNPDIAQQIAQRTRMESSWIQLKLHKLLNYIVSKYQDQDFLNNGLHRCLIYFALDTTASLCQGQDREVIRNIFFDTDIIKIALQILKNNEMTFMEHTACSEIILRTQGFIKANDDHGEDKDFWFDLAEKYDLNVIKLLIKQCVNCFKLTSYHSQLKPYHSYLLLYWRCKDFEEMKNDVKSQEEIPTYRSTQISTKNRITKNIHFKMVTQRYQTLSALKLLVHRFSNDPNSIIWKNITSMDLKRLLQISTIYMREGQQSASKIRPPTLSTTDLLVHMVQHKIIAEKMMSDNEIIEMLIICLRSRGRMCEYNYREIVPILYYIIFEHELLPKEYVNDAILALMDLREETRKNLSMCGIPGLPALITLITKCLKYLFGVKKYQRIDQDEYLCPICQGELDFPHALKCGHNMCYNCLTPLIHSGMTNYDLYVLKQKPKNQCPVCRQPFDGEFAREDQQSAFVLNIELCNKMNASLIVFEEDEYDDFKGTEADYYQYLKRKNSYGCDKQDLKLIINSTEMIEKYYLLKCVDIIVDYVLFDMVKAEFEVFCDFMMLKTKVWKDNHVKEEQIKHVLMAKEIKKEGNLLFKQKQYVDAIIKYKQCLSICPLWNEDRAIYYGNIGICYQKMKDWANLFRISQNGLSANPVAIKPLSHAAIGLSKMLLTENNNLGLINNNLHSQICLNGTNDKCLTRRVYDIILLQLAWDCQFFYTQTKISTVMYTPKMMQKLRTMSLEQQLELQKKVIGNDELLKELKAIQTNKMERCGAINNEEIQYYQYYWMIADMKKNIHDFIVDKLLNDKKESVSIISIMDVLREYYNNETKLYAYLRLINLDTIMFITDNSYIIYIENEKEIFLTKDNDIIDNYKMIKNDNDDNLTDDDDGDDVKERNIMIQKVYKINERHLKDNKKKLEQVVFEDMNFNPVLTTCPMYMWELEKVET
eukprot:200005_1